MSNNLVQESDESIAFFTNFLSHLRFMKIIYIDVLENFDTIEDKGSIENFFKLNDVSSLITICHLDLITNSKNLYLAKSDWEKIFFIKNTFLVIYETINSFHKHGKFLYEKSKLTESSSELYRIAGESLKNFKKDFKYNSHINKIRNTISGHINENFEEYYDEIMNFDGEKTALMTSSFFTIIGNYQNLLNVLMENIKLDTTKISKEKLAEFQSRLEQIN